MQDVEYGPGGALGLARTWPQAACCLPSSSAAAFDWEGDRPLNLPMRDLIIYEAHVRGFTWDPSAGAASPGDRDTCTRTCSRHKYFDTLMRSPVFSGLMVCNVLIGHLFCGICSGKPFP